MRKALPPNWAWAPLSDLGRWYGGGTPSKSNPAFWEDGAIPWVSPKDMKVLRIRDAEDHITPEAVEQSATNLVPAGAVLVVTRSGILRHSLPVAVTETEVTINQDLKAFIPHLGIESDYIAYALQAFESEILAKTSKAGTTVQSIEFTQLHRLEMPIAPSAEQKRVVREIEKQLSRLDFGVGCLRSAQEKLSRYRIAVLKAACEGRLVPTEAELARVEGREFDPKRHPPGDELKVESASRERHADLDLHKLPKGWSWTTVERLNPEGRPCAYGVLQPGTDVEDGALFVRVGDIDEGRILKSNLKRIDPAIAVSYPRTCLQGGEVLITLVGAIGRTAVVPHDLAGANTARAVGVIPLIPNVDPRWVEIWLRNPRMRAEMASKAHEVARKTLNLEDVRRAPVALPPKGEQERIVAEVERRLSLVEQLEHEVGVSLSRAERLRQSILNHGFEGKLVPSDPTDEPASGLLERICKIREGESRDGNSRERTRNATPRRGTGIKPGVSTPGTGTTRTHPKPRRGAGSVREESAYAPPGLPDHLGTSSLGLKPQALRPSPAGAEEKGKTLDVAAPSAGRTGEEDTAFLDLPREAQIDLVWESLLGRGALEKDEAIRTAAQFLRDQGRAQFQRFRQGGPLYQAIAAALDRGIRDGSFDRPKRGHVRALLTDSKDYSPDEWRLCLMSSLDHEAVDEGDALRAAAEWARENLGLEFARLREDGVILRGLRVALEEAVRKGEVTRMRGLILKERP